MATACIHPCSAEEPTGPVTTGTLSVGSPWQPPVYTRDLLKNPLALLLQGHYLWDVHGNRLYTSVIC
jgi:hypothetical protein